MTIKRQITVDSENRIVITEIYRKTFKASAGKLRKIFYETRLGSVKEEHLKKIVLNGKWSLTPEHDLKLSLSGKNSYFGKTVILRGDIISVSANVLRFKVRQSSGISGLRTSTLKLKGKWQADSYNRIEFSAAKTKGRYDVIKFQGGWNFNKRNMLVYQYAKTELKRKTKINKALIFRGYLDLSEDRIIYRFEKSKNSFFSFKAGLQSRSLRSSDGVIKYQVGIKFLRGKVYRTIRQTLTIYGKWKFGKDFSVVFNAAYAGNKLRSVSFSIGSIVCKNGKITISLKNKKGKPVGAKIIFSQIFNKDSELFLSLGRFAKESRILGGIKVKF